MADKLTGSNRVAAYLIFSFIALLCCLGGLGAAGYLYVKYQRDIPGMRAAGEAYLTAAVSGDYGAAYDLLCERDRREQPRTAFVPIANPRTPPTGFRITKVDVVRPGDAVTVRRVFADVTHAGYPPSEVELHIEKQDGAWKVCRPPAL